MILYGWHKKSNTWLVLNYTLIIAKYHIFTTSVGNGSLDFEGFRLSRLKSKLTILRTIASTNNNLEQFTETWAAVLQGQRFVCVLLCASVALLLAALMLLYNSFTFLFFLCPVEQCRILYYFAILVSRVTVQQLSIIRYC